MKGSKLNKSPQGKGRRVLGPRSDSGYDSRIHGQPDPTETADNKVGGTKTPKLRLTIGKRKRRLSAAELRGAGGDALLKECRSKGSTVVVRLKNLFTFGDEDRLVVLDFLSALDGGAFEVEGKKHPCLLEAVLALFRRDMPPQTMRTARLAALEAAVFKFADSLDVACDAIKRRMQDVGCTGVKPQGLKKDAQAIQTKLVAAARRAPSQTGTTVKAAVADAPVPADAVVPGGWLMSATGVRRAGEGSAQSLSTAVVVTEVSRDVLHGRELVTVVWKRDGGWDRATVERKVIANKNAVLELASHGLPVHSGNATVLVQFVHDYLVENQTRLGATKVSGQMGWQGKDGADGFLLGQHLIAAGRTGGKTDPDVRFSFRGADGGDEQLAAGFHAAGTYKEWRAGIKLIRHHPRVRLCFYTAFVPTTLRIFGAENFVLDYAGATSQGKTTTLRVGAGVWGNPRGGRGEGTTLHNWDSTQTWRERAPAVMNNLPLFLDDTKTVRHPDEIAQTVYTFTQGRGRGRGTIGGLAEQIGFESVLISSGDRPVRRL